MEERFTDAGRSLCTVVVVPGAVSIFAHVGAVVVEAIAGGILTVALAERRRWKTIERLRDHYITLEDFASRDAVA